MQRQITEYLPPNSMSKTEYGIISNIDWLIMEKHRIEQRTGKRCTVKYIVTARKCVELALFYLVKNKPVRVK